MARHVTHTHFFVEKFQAHAWNKPTETYESNRALCGYEAGINHWFSPDETKVTCPKCSAALGKRKLAELAQQGTVIELEPMRETDRPRHLRDMKGAYKVTLNGEHTGYIAIAHGWGQDWFLFNIRERSTIPGDNRVSRRGGHSKEYMAALIPSLIAEGKHQTPAVIAEERRAADARLETWRENRQREAEAERKASEEKARRRTEAEEAITSVLERFAGKLSNLETAGLQSALALLNSPKED